MPPTWYLSHWPPVLYSISYWRILLENEDGASQTRLSSCGFVGSSFTSKLIGLLGPEIKIIYRSISKSQEIVHWALVITLTSILWRIPSWPSGIRSVRWKVFSTVEGNSALWRVFNTVGDIISTVQDTIDIVEDIQFCGGNHKYCRYYLHRTDDIPSQYWTYWTVLDAIPPQFWW